MALHVGHNCNPWDGCDVCAMCGSKRRENMTISDKDWKIEWATVYANAGDVAHAKSVGKRRKPLSIGDPLWRRATAIGPLNIDHNHWVGWCFDCDEADVLLAASAPRLKAENERLRALLAEAEGIVRDYSPGHTVWLDAVAAERKP